MPESEVIRDFDGAGRFKRRKCASGVQICPALSQLIWSWWLVWCAVKNVTVGESGSVTDTVTVNTGLPGATNDERQLN